jgi:hypothetical protein
MCSAPRIPGAIHSIRRATAVAHTGTGGKPGIGLPPGPKNTVDAVLVSSSGSFPIWIVCVILCVPIQAAAGGALGLKMKASETAVYVCPPVCRQKPWPGLRNAGGKTVVVSVSVPPLPKVRKAGAGGADGMISAPV